MVRREFQLMMLLGALCLLGSSAAQGELGPPILEDKKLIGWNANCAEPAILREHIVQMERELPLEGMVIFVYPDDWQWGRTGQEDLFFGGRSFTRDDFQQALADLKATRFRQFTDNFIQFAASARGARYTSETEGNLDWFDPNWSVVANNAAVIAWLAKEAGFKGFFLDVEHYPYSPTPPWEQIFNYDIRPDKDKRSFEKVAAQVRKRGREWMAAVTSVYPDITIVIIPETAIWRRTRSIPPLQMPDPPSALVPSFVQGMLDRRGHATIIDGIEIAYWPNAYDTFAALTEEAETYGFKNLEYALGVWLDPGPDRYGGWHTNAEDLEKNYRSPWRLEHTLYDALRATDRYVWLYIWHKVWFRPDLRLKEKLPELPRSCMLCPHERFPQEYTDALRNCRKPHKLNQVTDVPLTVDEARRAEKIFKGKNLLRNGSFEEWRAAPRGWPQGSVRPVRWRTTEVAMREDGSVKAGSYALTMSNMKDYARLGQTIPLGSRAGKTILFGAWVRTSSRVMVQMEMVDYANGKYTATPSHPHPGDGSWHFIMGKRSIPAKATGRLRFRFNLYPRLPRSLVYTDGVRAIVEQ